MYEENLRVFFISYQVGDHQPPIEVSAVASCTSSGSALGSLSAPLWPSIWVKYGIPSFKLGLNSCEVCVVKEKKSYFKPIYVKRYYHSRCILSSVNGVFFHAKGQSFFGSKKLNSVEWQLSFCFESLNGFAILIEPKLVKPLTKAKDEEKRRRKKKGKEERLIRTKGIDNKV